MLNVNKLIASAEECLGWPYVSPGTNDENGIDCSGLFVKCYRDQGARIYHGSNTIFHDYCSATGKINGTGNLMPGMAVFKLKAWTDADKNNKWYGQAPGNLSHIGLVISANPLRIIHASSVSGKVTIDTKIGKWAYWGALRDVDYRGTVPDEKEEVVVVVEYAKVKGGTLNLRSGKGTNYPRVAQIPSGATVAVVEHGDEWSKVTYNNYTGSVMTEFLSFDNDEGDITLTIPRENALALYEALKTSLKL